MLGAKPPVSLPGLWNGENGRFITLNSFLGKQLMTFDHGGFDKLSINETAMGSFAMEKGIIDGEKRTGCIENGFDGFLVPDAKPHQFFTPSHRFRRLPENRPDDGQKSFLGSDGAIS